jgi:APA family basic amino acid/polyamine antiporter
VSPPAGLRRSLSQFDLTMIAIGSTIGSGIFLTPALITRTLVAPGWIAAAWLMGGLMALSGALTLSELGAMMPRAGGVYVYLSETYGGLAGFLYGWAYFLIVNTGGIAALALAFATYLGYLIPLGGAETLAAAIAGLVILTAINVAGVRAGGIFSDIFTSLKLIGIAGLILAAFTLGTPPHPLSLFGMPGGMPGSPAGGGLSGALAAALVGVFWSIGGWQHATYAAGEVKDPQRTLPRAMIVAAAAVTVLYLLTVVAYMFMLTGPEIAASSRLAADAMERVLGPIGGGAIALTVFVSTFGTAGIYTLTAPRIYYAMALDGVFFQGVGRLHPRFGTPYVAIITQSAWAIVLILFWGTFENLISYVVFTDWIFFALAGAAVPILRRRRPDAPRPYRTVLYPATPLFFVAGSVWFVANTLVSRTAEAAAGIGFLLLGVPVYYLWKKK